MCDDFSQFDAPVETAEIPGETDSDYSDSGSDINAIMDAGEDDFAQFEETQFEEDIESNDAPTSDEIVAESTPVELEQAKINEPTEMAESVSYEIPHDETNDNSSETTDITPVDVQEVVDTSEIQDISSERQYDDFEQTVLVENPDFYETGSYYTQGINEFGYQGTCGPTSQANALNEVLGTNEFTENKILNVAVNNNLCDTSGYPEDCGGTDIKQFMELYDKVNEQIGGKIETDLFTNDPDLGMNNALSLEQMADKLDEGSILNIAVDSCKLWEQEHSFTDPMGGRLPDDFYSDHWITVTGAQRDDLGNIQGFDVIDSGGGVNYVSAEQYQEMCFGTEEHKVTDPTCIAVSQKDLHSDVPEPPPELLQTEKPS